MHIFLFFIFTIATFVCFFIKKSHDKKVTNLQSVYGDDIAKAQRDEKTTHPHSVVSRAYQELDHCKGWRTIINYFFYISLCFLVLTFAFACITTVPAGHVKVATLFGKINDEEYKEGFHIVNPLYKFHLFDARQKTHKETANVPSQDQLTTSLDVSVQYRIIATETPNLLGNTGTLDDAIFVHLVPKLRSILREQGKTIARAEDFFLESTQVQLQQRMLSGLQEYLQPRGIAVSNVLIREVRLPPFILKAIQDKKEREQAAERQIAELQRFATEQEQKIKTAEAEKAAAELDAEKIKLLADAEAYKIEQINRQLSKSPQYVKLKTVEQWNGKLPVYAGGDNIPMIDLRSNNSD